jgi:hypothetical protein
MSALLRLEEYPKTADLWSAINEQFIKGVEMVHLAEDAHIVGLILSPAAAKETLARRIAERWVADPASIEDLLEKAKEKPEDWE